MGLKRIHRILGVLISVVIPIATMEGLHISWEPDFNGKMRMAMKQMGFWGGFLTTILVTHRYGFRQKSFGKALPIFLAAAPIPLIGYQAMKKLAPMVFPRQQKASIATDDIFIPSALPASPMISRNTAQESSPAPAVIWPATFPAMGHPASATWPGGYYAAGYGSYNTYNPYAYSYSPWPSGW
jgi:hypothetical protein